MREKALSAVLGDGVIVVGIWGKQWMKVYGLVLIKK
jgi:hypothetical protein